MKTKKSANIFAKILYFGISICGGILMGLSISYAPAVMDSMPALIGFCLFCVFSASIVQIIVHEGGHLLFGLLSGYRFSSFRIGSLALVRVSGKFKLRRYSVSGTAGQCLMLPPEEGWENMKVIAYNMGGALLNIITALAAFFLADITEGFLADWLGTLGTMGMVYAALNGVPINNGQLSNDGSNMLNLVRNPSLKKCFWVQLAAVGALAEGTRLRDMPQEWFAIPEGYDFSNPLCSAVRIMETQRLMDQGRYETAAEEMRAMLRQGGLQGLYENLIRLDLVTAEMITSGDDADTGVLKEKAMKRFMSSMGRSPSVIRTLYCAALVNDKDPKKAQELRKKFERTAVTYPYPAELHMERELMDAALERSKED
ncbi:MAG: hypothetical protein J5822_01555 [Eubacteriaceae bacterium]|nr:hypothetical protein [Eubacteriaceae bacterium]